MDKQRKLDLKVASEICSDYGQYDCLKAVQDMLKAFGDEVKIIHINQADKALNDILVLSDRRDYIVTEASNHFASFIHGYVFDNIFHDGLRLDDWLSSFMYISKQNVRTRLVEADINWMTRKELTRYVR